MKCRQIENTNIYHAITVDKNGKKSVFALIGTVRELAEKEIIFLDGKKPNDLWIALIPKMGDNSSREYDTFEECKNFVEKMEHQLR